MQSFEMWVHGFTKSDKRCEEANYSEAGPMLLGLGMQ
jgi:hypothetical protein